MRSQQILKHPKASSAYNPISKQLYIPQNKAMLLFDLKTKTLQRVESKMDGMALSRTTLMDNKCHTGIIGGRKDK